MDLDKMKEQGISCNDCWYAMQNCHDKSICCEIEEGLCDSFMSIEVGERIKQEWDILK